MRPGDDRARVDALRGTVIALLLSFATFEAPSCTKNPAPGGESVEADARPEDARGFAGSRVFDDISLDGSDPEVRRAIERAIEVARAAPSSAGALGALGVTLLAHERFEPARQLLARAAKIDANDVRWPYLLGVAYLEGEPDLPRALESFERAASSSTTDSVPWGALGDLRLESGDLEGADRAFRGALRAAPDDPRAHLGLARIACSRGDANAALEHVDRSIARGPNVRATRALRSQILFRLGRTGEAEAEADRAETLPLVHRWDDRYQRLVDECRTGPVALTDRASDLFGRGKRDEAIALLDRGTKEHPGAILVHLLLGRLLLESGRTRDAEAPLRRAIELAPDAFEAHHELGTTLERLERFEEAGDEFRRAIELAPGFAPSHYRLAHVEARIGDRAGAIASLRAAVRHRPGWGGAWRDLAHLLGLAGQVDDAHVAIERALVLSPNDARAREIQRILSRR